MSKEQVVIGNIVASSGFPEGSKNGHDQLVVYVEDKDGNLFRAWETLSLKKCEKGRHKGEPYRTVRLAELGIPKFSEVEERLEGARAILTYSVQKNAAGEVLTDDKAEEPLYSWKLDRIIHPKREEATD